MDELEQRIESLKLLQDWSKWLIGLETGVCVLLWRGFAGETKPPFCVYMGWFMFWASIVAAAFLLITISVVVRERGASAERNMKKVWSLVAAEYAFFLGGMFFFAWRIIQLWPHLNSAGGK